MLSDTNYGLRLRTVRSFLQAAWGFEEGMWQMWNVFGGFNPSNLHPETILTGKGWRVLKRFVPRQNEMRHEGGRTESCHMLKLNKLRKRWSKDAFTFNCKKTSYLYYGIIIDLHRSAGSLTTFCDARTKNIHEASIGDFKPLSARVINGTGSVLLPEQHARARRKNSWMFWNDGGRPVWCKLQNNLMSCLSVKIPPRCI